MLRMWFSPPKETPIVIEVVLYRLHVVVFIGWSVDDIVQWGLDGQIDHWQFTESWKTWTRNASETAKGWCTNYGGNGNSDVVTWLKDRPTKASEYGTLWHELVHAVDKIANQADPGAHFYDDSWQSEPRAFLYEYLAVEISKVLWNR